ncbi:MAG: hypothetical protein LBC77_03000 [Spirochaetaceae bacterium]|jgi:hypothetical protein|nr:hypothetical protein [Spirochaetaceae bacterium]
MRLIPGTIVLFLCAAAVFGEANAALAENYLDYLPIVETGQGAAAAETFLIRAQDWAADSSDLSFELARVREELKRPRRSIIAALDRALSAKYWTRRSENEALLAKSEQLLALMDYYGTLSLLERAEDSAEKERAVLKALSALKRDSAFRTRFREAQARYGEEFFDIALDWAAGIERPTEEDRALIDDVVRRVMRSERHSALLYRAAPFIYDTALARGLLSAAYMSKNLPPPVETLPAMLNLGVIGEEAAIDILFSAKKPVLDEGILRSVYMLLRTEEARILFEREIAAFTGGISRDKNKDGIYDALTIYSYGLPVRVDYDGKQEREVKASVKFTAGEPAEAILGEFTLDYGIYPAVEKASEQNTAFYFIPDTFFYAPVHFERLAGEDSPLYPVFDEGASPVNAKMLYAFAYVVERPSVEFSGAVEELRLVNGVVISAVERFDGRRVSQTIYKDGRPLRQNADLDLDGRLETIRYFVQNDTGETEIDYIEVDWTGNGVYERE